MSFNIYFIYAIIFILAGGGTLLISTRWFRFAERYSWLLVTGMVILTAGIYATLSCWRYNHLIYGIWDFGANDAMIFHMSKFNGFLNAGGNNYSEHFIPLLVLFSPFYWIYDSPFTILILQSVLMAAGGIPLYFLARRKLAPPWQPVLLVMMYLLNPYFSRFTLYEFHVGCLGPLFYFPAVLAWEKNQKWLFLLLMFLLPMIKETFIVVLIAHGLFLLSRKGSRYYGTAILGMAVFWTCFITKIWFPHIIPLVYHHSDRYPSILAGSWWQVVVNLWFFVINAFSLNSLAVGISIFGAFVFLPLFSWRVTILLCGPVLMSHFTSSNQHQQLLMAHYSDIIIPTFAIAALYGMTAVNSLPNKLSVARGYYYRLCWTLPVVMHVFLCDLPIVKYHNYILKYMPSRQFGILSIPFNLKMLSFSHPGVFKEIVPLIPRGKSIAAQNNLGCEFVRYHNVFLLPGPPSPDFYLFDHKTDLGFDSPQTIGKLLDRMSSDPAYCCLFNYDGFLVFCRRELIQDVEFRAKWEALCRKYPLK